jgi:hypothetical protein
MPGAAHCLIYDVAPSCQIARRIDSDMLRPPPVPPGRLAGDPF